MRRTLVVIVSILLMPFPLVAQSGTRSFRDLTASVGQVDAVGGVIDVRVQLPSSAASTQPTSNVTLLGRQARAGSLRRDRRPQLTAGHLVAVLIDYQGRELDWRIVADPRVGRVEWQGTDGHLTGQSIITAGAPLRIVLPDVAGAARLRIYQTSTIDEGGQLAMIGEVALR